MKNWPIVCIAFVLLACKHAPTEREEATPVAVRCEPPKRETVDVTTTLRGRIAAPPGGDLPVASQVAGRVQEVEVHEGDHVIAGTVIATIDGSASRDAVRQADANVTQAKAAQANADATLDRTRQLVGRGIAAKQELDDAIARADQAKAAVASAGAASDLARRTLGRVQVRSTFDGVVTRVWRGAGALVDGTAATPIVQLSATSLAELDADATEKQLAGIEPGEQATVVLAAGGDPLPATVRTRATALDPATGLGFVRFDVISKQALTLGAFATVTVHLAKRDGVLLVPASAMRGPIADGAELVVCKNGRADVRTVKVGWRDDNRVEIVAGLGDDERVVTDRALGLEADAPLAESK